LGYDGKQNRLYLIDKTLNIVSYSLLLSLINYQAAILNDDIHGAQQFFKDIPITFHSKLAKFLEANNQKEMAFDITPDKDHKFDLALQLNKIEEASSIAEEQESVDKWKKVGDIALMSGYFDLAERCFDKSQDYNSLLLFYSSFGDEEGLKRLVESAERNGKYNVALEAAYLLADPETCINILLKSKRVAEAAMFARAYAPSKIDMVMKQWEDLLKQS
jgi:coatomer subunit beta'